jgi:hypothetical protein
MLPAHPHATIFALFANQTHTVFIKNALFFSDCTEGENSPRSAIGTELPAWPVDDSSLREKSSS